MAASVLLMLQACQKPPTRGAAERFNGLLRSDSSFVTSPGGCAISVLYDTFQVPRASQSKASFRQERRIEIAPIKSQQAIFEIRGTADNLPWEGEVRITIDGKEHVFNPDKEGIEFQVTAPLSGAEIGTPVVVVAELAKGTRSDALLTIDSLDIVLKAPKGCK